VTFVEFAAVVRRRRWIVALGTALTIVVAAVGLQPEVVYTARVDVVLLIPYTADGPNVLQARTAALIATAGVVADDINGPSSGPQTVGGVALADQGLNDNWSVRLPNSGGQWDNNFADPVLNLEATSSTAEQARSRLDQLVQRVRDVLTAREAAVGVPEHNRIRTLLSPSVPAVTLGGSRANQARAAVVVLGLLLTLLLAFAVDWASHRLSPRGGRRVPSKRPLRRVNSGRPRLPTPSPSVE